MKLWAKILLIILLTLVIIINLIFMPVGLPYAWIPIAIDVIIIGLFGGFAVWACVKVGADSERNDKK